MVEQELAPTRAPEAAATLTSSATSVVTWAVGHYAFHGVIPPELYGFIQLCVPALLGWAGACIARRRAARSTSAGCS